MVSVGSPIIKYSFTEVQPPAKALVQVRSTSSSVTFLLITSRIRWVPASGAKVSPLRRTLDSLSTSSSLKLSTRRLGRDKLILSRTVQSIREVSISLTQLWSEVDREHKDSSSYPVESISALD